jgi:hypothetical protein
MAGAVGPVVAIVDRAEDDAEVVAEAAWLARAMRTHVLLVHVARPIGRIGLEVCVQGELQHLARQARAVGVAAQAEDVYFNDGDASAEVAYVANRRCASAVVAARRPRRFLSWRSRDRRLGRLLRVPLVLVEPDSAPRPALPAAEAQPGGWTPEVQVQPGGWAPKVEAQPGGWAPAVEVQPAACRWAPAEEALSARGPKQSAA